MMMRMEISCTGSDILLQETNAPNIRKKKNDDAEVLYLGAGVELGSSDLVFKTLYLLYIWKEPVTVTKSVSAAILLHLVWDREISLSAWET